jgi:hypothetical protein
MKPHRGPIILTFGILSLVVCPLLGFWAWFMGDSDLEEMKRGKMDTGGRDFTNVGRICGMVATGLFFIQVIIIALFFVMSWATAR